MGSIQVLSFELANLIAAGEVVDRPASVLKELLENAIDAGATRITAEIKRGGVALIRVSDNGCGIAAEDLPVAIRRHATSKIREAGDLDAIATLGFRGEALAAIAAVSELRIMTKTRTAEAGTMLVSEGGIVTDISEVGTADGTTVVVENLFANVPARRKFLKKDATETMASAAVVEKIAMSRPDISFELITDGMTRFKTAGDGQLKNALYAILGRDFAGRLLPLHGNVQGIAVTGFVGTSDNVRNNRNHQNIFINGRYVKSKTVMAALEKAYTSYIAPERFPVCALFLTVQPNAVDVNVHPAKLEVKFSDERVIFEAVYYAVRSALEENVSRPELELPSKKQSKNPLSAFVPVGDTTRAEQLSATRSLFSTPSAAPTQPPKSSPASAPAPREAQESERVLSVSEALGRLHAFREEVDEGVKAPVAPPKLAFASPAKLGEEEPAAPAPIALKNESAERYIPVMEEKTVSLPEEKPAEQPAQEPTPFTAEKDWRIVGEAFRCYVFVERGDELLLIDKHAAHERILFEELLARQRQDGRVGTQYLLVPLRVSLSDEELAAAEEYAKDLEAVGFDFTIDRTGHAASVSAVPDAVDMPDAEELFARMAAELAEGAGNPAITEEKRRERTLYQVACKAAIKGGRQYGEAQIAWLVERVMALPDITVCPHGRPIAVRLTKHYLDRQFNRIM
jgi:DNA mismatch repair protein MutL